jgi:hypothetical protein
MKVLHVLETSVPELVGYTVRGRYIVDHQRRQGLEPIVVTSPFFRGADGQETEVIDGITYFRSKHIPRPDKARGLLGPTGRESRCCAYTGSSSPTSCAASGPM